MATVQIPVRSDLDDWSQVVDLDGASYQLRWHKNLRETAWMLDIRDADGTDLLVGRAVRVNVPLNGWLPRAGLPRGILMAVDTSGQEKEIENYDELGERVKVEYIPEDDL